MAVSRPKKNRAARLCKASGPVKKRGGSKSRAPPRLGRIVSRPLLGRLVGARRQARLVARGGVAVEHALLHGLVYERDGRGQERLRRSGVAAFERGAQPLDARAQPPAVAAVDLAPLLVLARALLC